MQALEQFRIRKTPFGDTPTPTETRYARDFVARDAAPVSRYEIFSLQPALDGLSAPGSASPAWGGGSASPAPGTHR